ncbi:integral membrane protein [Xylaria flabelliformis]|nr:integral membrane protein [Xylaria flabelliformis]KAI0865164.1 hypothetical protein F4860DRAFT_462529 [Xylaria cubensis]
METSSTPTANQFPPGYLEIDQSSNVIAATTTILVISTVLFLLRLIARSLTPAKRGWDDHLLIPSYFLLLALIIVIYLDVNEAGVGRHTAAVVMEDPNKITKFLFFLYLLDWFYVPSNMLSRVSVVVLYLRIFTDKWARVACWAVIAFLVANCVGTTIAAQLECTPLRYTWDKSIPGGSCFDQLLWYKLTNFPNIVGDLLVFLLPIKTVWTLKSSFWHRLGIAVVCLTGSIGIIASSVRTSVFFLQADVIEKDPTFAHSTFSWTVIECGFYFSAACLIGLRPLITQNPWSVKRRAQRSAQSVEGGTGREGDEVQLNKFYNSRYTAMDDDMEDIMQMPIEPSVTARQPAHPSDPERTGASDILVKTSIEVWKDLKSNPGKK